MKSQLGLSLIFCVLVPASSAAVVDRAKTTTTPPPAPKPLMGCDRSSIPRVTYSDSNKTGDPHFWHDGLHFYPCIEAWGHDNAILDQVHERFLKGLWAKNESGVHIKTEGGEKAFMKTTIQYALTIFKTGNFSNNNVTSYELCKRFCEDFSVVKCLKLKSATLGYFACGDAVLPNYDGIYSPFKEEPATYMKYVQSKVLIYTLLFGEYKTVVRKLILRRKRMEFAYELIRLANKNDRQGVAFFLSANYIENIVTVMTLSDDFLTVFRKCYLGYDRAAGMDLEDCIDVMYAGL